MKSGDVITAVDGETVADPHELARRIAALGPKKTVKLSLIRDGSPMTIDVTLGTMPADKTASAETRNSDDNGGSALAKLGLTLRAARGQDGVVVADVDPDGAAADKGLKQGDVILEVAGKSVNRPSRGRRGDRRGQVGRQEVGSRARQVQRWGALSDAADARVLDLRRPASVSRDADMKWAEGFMGSSPARRIARPSVQVGGRTYPRPRDPDKVAAGPHQAPRGPAAIPFWPKPHGIRYMSDMRILIIEDDRDAAAYLAKAFREAGHVADQANDGVTGYDLALEGGYDVAIVDRMLPKMDGLTLVGALRKQNNETPVLILSALGQVDDRVKGLRAGGDDYLSKPYAFSELLARVEALARRGPKGAPEETVLGSPT